MQQAENNAKNGTTPRDHGGGLDSAAARFGGTRSDWIDLSTGINPVPYPLPKLPEGCWTALPDSAAQSALLEAARGFWEVPDSLDIVAAPGASALIAALPRLLDGARVAIPAPTYNEHAAAFRANGWQVSDTGAAVARVLVHPNNPDGHLWTPADFTAPQIVLDESFADTDPAQTLLPAMARRGQGHVTLKSFGKFWGLAGMRLGFAIGDPGDMARLRELLGPWAVSGPALAIGTAALRDEGWATATRARLAQDAARLDTLVAGTGATALGGTSLFRLYDTEDAADFQDRLARHHIWSRIFPYSGRWVRLGLPGPDDWPRLEAALRP